MTMQVDLVQDLKDQYKTAEKAEEAHKKKQLILSWATVILLLITAFFAGWQGWSSGKSAKAAEEAIKTARDQVRLDERAWAGVDMWVLRKVEVGQPVDIAVRVLNRGKTPALEVKTAARGGKVISNDHSAAEKHRHLGLPG